MYGQIESKPKKKREFSAKPGTKQGKASQKLTSITDKNKSPGLDDKIIFDAKAASITAITDDPNNTTIGSIKAFQNYQSLDTEKKVRELGSAPTAKHELNLKSKQASVHTQ